MMHTSPNDHYSLIQHIWASAQKGSIRQSQAFDEVTNIRLVRLASNQSCEHLGEWLKQIADSSSDNGKGLAFLLGLHAEALLEDKQWDNAVILLANIIP